MHRRLKDEKLRVAYTAFGDPVMPDGQGGWRVGWPVDLGTRYQYDGGWGYESGAWGPGPGGQGAVAGPLALWGENLALPPVTLQHVGWRWYQPSIGRFVQRDPVGLRGGLNVYAYCNADPLSAVDVQGLYTFGDLNEYWTRKTPEQAYIDLTGGRDSWMDDPRKVAKVRWCIDVSATLVTWLAPEIGVVKRVIRIGGRTITIIKWIINGIEVWVMDE